MKHCQTTSAPRRLALGMTSSPFIGLPLLLAALLVTGCQQPSGGGDKEDDGKKSSIGTAHVHEGDDELFWQREDVEHDGFLISLGHHGVHHHAGDEIEPAVSITRDGEPVADAQVFVAIDAAGEINTPTTYEPPTAEEPAHYAQAKLMLPRDAAKVTLRFRIVLPGDVGEKTYDVPMSIDPPH